jgi:hypothetical protein
MNNEQKNLLQFIRGHGTLGLPAYFMSFVKMRLNFLLLKRLRV